VGDILLNKTTNISAATIRRDGVSILGPGIDPKAGFDRYGGSAFRSILHKLRTQFDYVITVTPPLSSALGVAAAGAADHSMLVVPEITTTESELATLFEASKPHRVMIQAIVTVPPRQMHRKKRSDRLNDANIDFATAPPNTSERGRTPSTQAPLTAPADEAGN
jgi:cellulose biosynthesis protein BcsQ